MVRQDHDGRTCSAECAVSRRHRHAATKPWHAQSASTQSAQWPIADAQDGTVYHYRDKSGLECDAVMHLRGGRYGLIEVKLGGDKLISEGAETLKALARNIDYDKMREPSFKMVLTAIGQFAYSREDGVMVVPIGCLRP